MIKAWHRTGLGTRNKRRRTRTEQNYKDYGLAERETEASPDLSVGSADVSRQIVSPRVDSGKTVKDVTICIILHLRARVTPKPRTTPSSAASPFESLATL